MSFVSNEDAKRIGAELRRWADRPIRATNTNALTRFGVALALMIIAAQQSPNPAAAIHGIATLFAVLQSTLHLMAAGLLRGLARGGIAEAQHALASARDPRRISNLDMAALWTLLALSARLLE